jgi:hypothetical protein
MSKKMSKRMQKDAEKLKEPEVGEKDAEAEKAVKKGVLEARRALVAKNILEGV